MPLDVLSVLIVSHLVEDCKVIVDVVSDILKSWHLQAGRCTKIKEKYSTDEFDLHYTSPSCFLYENYSKENGKPKCSGLMNRKAVDRFRKVKIFKKGQGLLCF